MKLVIVESPYAGDVEANEAYARRCMVWCLKQGWAPFASHLLYTQPGVLDDTKPAERRKGIDAGFAWGVHAEMRIFFVDHGFSRGMVEGLKRGLLDNQEIRFLRFTDGPEWVEAEAFTDTIRGLSFAVERVKE